jgi:MYXO-CTERM domain-containing protein
VAPVLVALGACGTSSQPVEQTASLESPARRPAAREYARASLEAAARLADFADARRDPAFHFGSSAEGLRARTPTLGLVTTSDARGFTVGAPRGFGAVRLSTSAIRCDVRRSPVSEAAPATVDGRPNEIGWAREADGKAFDEWLLNGPRGLEHGYTIAADPCGGAAELVLEIDAEGLAPRAVEGGVALLDASGHEVARYEGLYAEDAGRRLLPARLVVTGSRIEIHVEVAAARWPVLIDPMVTTQAPPLLASDGQANDGFASAVAIDADTAIVGAPGKTVGANAQQGAAYVFRRTAGAWSQESTLTSSDGTPSDGFGRAVALVGDVAAVGAPDRAGDPGAALGGVYVFTRAGTVWTQKGKGLSPSGAQAGERFGASMSLSGTTLAVGAPGRTVGTNAAQGALYVVDGSSGDWIVGPRLTASDGAAGDRLGAALSTDGNWIAVGAPGKTIAGRAQQGAAYVWARSGTSWTLYGGTISDPAGAANDAFGAAVAVGTARVLIGAPGATVGANAGQGRAYNFVDGGSSWAQATLPFSSSDGSAGDAFGAAIAARGLVAVVGAPGKASGTKAQQGRAYVFARTSLPWIEQSKLVASDGAANDRFGAAVALSSDGVLVGAGAKTVSGAAQRGEAYAFALTGSLGATCSSSTECATGLACNSGHCSTACHVCLTADPAACTAVSGVACDDGNACTRSDVCFSGVCAGQNANPCDCSTGGSCDPATGLCSGTPVANGTACSGGSCSGGQCILAPDAGPDVGADASEGGVDAGPDADAASSEVGDASGDSSTTDSSAGDSALADSTTSDATDAVADTDVPLPPPKGDSGCSCDAPGTQSTRSYGALAALGLALGLARRRRAR